ncbi:MAG: GntR family transcriptional regulator [Anaerolineales bacterium]|nr:GntR family transcriptional regulator [Anaerolineales bacterium]
MPAEADKITEADESYTRLYQAIVRGQLLPNERLVELELAEKFDVGRAAVRTALVRLEQEGLVEREPNRGARVRLVSEAEAVEMYEVRAVLEGLVARYAARNATDQDIATLRAIHKQMEAYLGQGELLKISDLNAELHEKLLQIAQHQTVTRLLERLRAQRVRFQYRTVLLAGRAQHSLAEHRAIIEAVAAHNSDAAESAMRQHLAKVTEAMRQSIGTAF